MSKHRSIEYYNPPYTKQDGINAIANYYQQLAKDNQIYRAKNYTLPEVKVTAKGNGKKYTPQAQAHSAARANMQQRVADRTNQGWVPNFMMKMGTLPFDVEGGAQLLQLSKQGLKYIGNRLANKQARQLASMYEPKVAGQINTVKQKHPFIEDFERRMATAEDNEKFLNNVNDYFDMYGYPRINVAKTDLENTLLVEDLVKNRIAEHNTYLRGVRDPKDVTYKPRLYPATVKQLEKRGIPNTKENRLKYSATYYAGDTGSGRAGIPDEARDIGTLYNSNSMELSAGYASNGAAGIGQPIGEIAVVRRPYTLGPDRNKWLQEGDYILRNDYSAPQNIKANDYIPRNYMAIPKTIRPNFIDILDKKIIENKKKYRY